MTVLTWEEKLPTMLALTAHFAKSSMPEPKLNLLMTQKQVCLATHTQRIGAVWG